MQGNIIIRKLGFRGAKVQEIEFPASHILTISSKEMNKNWDQIYFCIPSNALSKILLSKINELAKGASIIKFQPGLFEFPAGGSELPRAGFRVSSGLL